MKNFLRYCSFLLCYILGVYSVQAQCTPPYYACFTAPIRACVGMPVKMDRSMCNPLPGITQPVYNYNYPSGIEELNDTHTYNTPGTYTIRQFTIQRCDFIEQTIEIVDSPEPAYTLQTCADGTRNVTVTINDLIYERFAIDYNDGSPVDTFAQSASPLTHTYIADGKYNITVYGIFNPNNACASKTTAINVLRTLGGKPDVIDLRVLKQDPANGNISLRFQTLKNVSYRIERKSTGAYTTVGTITTTTDQTYTFNDLGLNTTIPYTYQVVAYDNCTLINEEISDEITSVVFTDVTLDHLSNTIEWNADAKNAYYYVSRDNTQFPYQITDNYFIDADPAIVCQQQYCYSSMGVLNTSSISAGAPHKSYSIDTCITAISKVIPPSVQNVNAGMTGNTVHLNWNDPGDAAQYTITRYKDNSPSSIPPVTANSYSEDLDISSNYCYSVVYLDNCKNSSPPSLSSCPVLLHGVQNGDIINLNWSNYIGYGSANPNVAYTVQKLDGSGAVLTEINVGTSTSYSEAVSLTDPFVHYRIKVTNTADPVSYNSNDVIFKFEGKLYAPDIFTPNADGTNDLFLLKGKYIKTFSLTIFNRWGEIVFNTTSMTEGWDGSEKSTYASDGAYTYKVEATDIYNTEINLTGTVTLAR